MICIEGIAYTKANIKIEILIVAKVGVIIRMTVCGTNVSVVEKGALWNNMNSSGPALKVK